MGDAVPTDRLLENDPQAQMAYMQLWAAHPELDQRQLSNTPEDEALWREFAEYYSLQPLRSFDPHSYQGQGSEVVVRTGVVLGFTELKRIPATTKVTPEVAEVIIRNLANKTPPFRPELGTVGNVSWFVIEGTPHVGVSAQQGKAVTIEAEVAVHPKDRVFESPELTRLRDQVLTPEFVEEKTRAYRQHKGIPAEKKLNSAQRKGLASYIEKKAERGMWEKVAEITRRSKTRAATVVFENSEFSKQGNGKFYLTADAAKIRIRGGIPQVIEAILRDKPSAQVPKAITQAAEEELKRLRRVGNVKAVFRVGGRLLLVVGAAADAYAIYQAQDRVRETVRVVGGWGGAFAAGAAFSVFFAPADVAGPWAWVAHGAGALVAGGIGYWVGSETTIWIYEVTIDPRPVAGVGSPGGE